MDPQRLSKLQDRPDELVHGIQKDLSGLVPFYSKGWAYITKEEKANKKFKAKAHRVKFLGFATEYKNAAIVQTDSGNIKMQPRDAM